MGVVCSYLQVDFEATQPLESLNSVLDELLADSFVTKRWTDRDGVEPAAVAVVAGDDGADDGCVLFGDEEEIILSRQLVVDYGERLIVGAIVGEDVLPERCNVGCILTYKRAYLHDLVGSVVGWVMMPDEGAAGKETDW